MASSRTDSINEIHIVEDTFKCDPTKGTEMYQQYYIINTDTDTATKTLITKLCNLIKQVAEKLHRLLTTSKEPFTTDTYENKYFRMFFSKYIYRQINSTLTDDERRLLFYIDPISLEPIPLVFGIKIGKKNVYDARGLQRWFEQQLHNRRGRVQFIMPDTRITYEGEAASIISTLLNDIISNGDNQLAEYKSFIIYLIYSLYFIIYTKPLVGEDLTKVDLDANEDRVIELLNMVISDESRQSVASASSSQSSDTRSLSQYSEPSRSSAASSQSSASVSRQPSSRSPPISVARQQSLDVPLEELDRDKQLQLKKQIQEIQFDIIRLREHIETTIASKIKVFLVGRQRYTKEGYIAFIRKKIITLEMTLQELKKALETHLKKK